MSFSVDVAIIGAGLSGLQAAVDVQKAGLSFLILEARDRVGGKTCSVQRADGKGIQEMGAAWINDSNQDRVWKWTEKFGLNTIKQLADGKVGFQDTDGQCHTFMYGELPKFTTADQDDCARIRDVVQAASLDPSSFVEPKRSSLDALTLDAYLRSHGASKRALQTAAIWCHGMLGAEPTDISALAFIEVCRGGLGIVNLRSDRQHGPQYLRLEEGTQAIALNMAALLPHGSIKLSSPVTAITQLEKNKISVTLQDGSVGFARQVVVSIPGPTYKNITFTPALPRDKQIYFTAVRYGYYVKYILMFKQPFWRKTGGCGLAQSLAGPVSIFRDTSCDSAGNYALTCFIGATPGRKWGMLEDHEREEAVLRQVSEVFQLAEEDVKAAYISSLTSPWMDDKWAGYGCPFAACPPGVMAKVGDHLTEPFNGIHFVGTEFTNEWRGYMDGALRSGERGAKEVIQALGQPSVKL